MNSFEFLDNNRGKIETPFFTAEDKDEIGEYIHGLFEKGERPVVTVPVQYIDTLKKGLESHTTWIFGFNAIAGTFGREPYLPEGEERVIVKINKIDETQVRPRFTGPQKAFQGVVILDGPIPPEAIEIIN